VSVALVPSLEEELLSRIARQLPPRAVGVTDLISLRRAYYRLVGPPVEIPEERRVRLEEGRDVHRTIGDRLAGEGILEARVRRDGLVGRIDILADVPIEVKTSAQLVAPPDLPTARPDHLEQLAMYGALVGHTSGRLLTLVTSGGVVSAVQAVDVSFRSVQPVLTEMLRRAALLRTAVGGSRPDDLPRCPWYGRGCEYQEAAICGCTGQEEGPSHPIVGDVDTIRARADVEERVRRELSAVGPPAPSPRVERFHEVLYPRRAYFERTPPRISAPSPEVGVPSRPPGPEKDLYARLTESLESGPAGEVARLPAHAPEPEQEVVGFRGRPVLIRTSRAWSRYRAEELLARSPQYAFELGLRCAVAGASSGLVVLGFERAEVERDRLQVLEVRFDTVTPFSRILRERCHDLREAIRDRTPDRLPSCPGWMATDCPYRSECGCGSSLVRDTR